MNLAETDDLLRYAASVDNRRYDDATVAAWHSILSDLTAADAMRAVRDHFAESREYLMPVHIRDLARNYQRERRRLAREAQEAAVEAQAALERGPTEDRSADVINLVGRVRSVLPEGDPYSLRWASAEWANVRRQREREATEGPNPYFRPDAYAEAARAAAALDDPA